MYNRYIPQSDGTYRKNRMPNQDPPPPPPAPAPPEPPVSPPPKTMLPFSDAGSFLRNLLPRGLDTGDLLIIVMLLLISGDSKENSTTALLTLALYLFL